MLNSNAWLHYKIKIEFPGLHTVSHHTRIIYYYLFIIILLILDLSLSFFKNMLKLNSDHHFGFSQRSIRANSDAFENSSVEILTLDAGIRIWEIYPNYILTYIAVLTT